jgi:general secretion pathway protein F
MPLYRYTALARSGETQNGEVEAVSQAAAIALVQERGLLPISAREASGFAARLNLSESLFAADKPGSRDVALLTQELSVLIGAGLPVDRALDVLRQMAAKPVLQRLVGDILTRVRGGSTLADALTAQGEVFPRFYWSTVQAAERGGFLAPALKRLAEYLARAQALRDSLRSAMIYPMLLVFMAGVSILFILMVVLPRFRSLFIDSGVALPWFTGLMMDAGVLLNENFPAFLAIVAVLALGLRQLFRASAFLVWRDSQLIRLPAIRSLILKAEIARFTRILSTLLAHGVNLPAALQLSAGIVHNRPVAAAIESAAAGVKEGQRLSDRLARTGLVPAAAIQLIRVGEETGELSPMLDQAAELFERDVQRVTERAIAILVPVITVLLGVIIAALIASIFSVLVSINELAL